MRNRQPQRTRIRRTVFRCACGSAMWMACKPGDSPDDTIFWCLACWPAVFHPGEAALESHLADNRIGMLVIDPLAERAKGDPA